MEQSDHEVSFSCPDPQFASLLFGQQNNNLKRLESSLKIRVGSRGANIHLQGERSAVMIGHELLTQIYHLVQKGYLPSPETIDYGINILKNSSESSLLDIFLDTIYVSAQNKTISPKTLTQKAYVDAIRSHDLCFGIGPADTGKTYLAIAVGVALLMRKEVSRIILVRPAVEAGEKLGFLPGDLAEKINPYLRPMYDALFDMVGVEKGQELIEKGVVEVAPLAFMRGRTLNDAFIILDEAQNTTTQQMKMFLTRIGFGSRAVITGDVTQIDLPSGQRSGLKEARQVLGHLEDVSFVNFSDVDVVRHPIVQQVVMAYDRFDMQQGAQDKSPADPGSK